MLTKRPASFLLTPQYRVDALWLNGTGPEVKAEAPLPRPRGAPATSADCTGSKGCCANQIRKSTLSLPEDAELIDQLHKLTGKMPKFAQFNPPPAAPTPAPSPSPQRMEAEAAQSRSVTNAEPPAATPLAFCDLTSGGAATRWQVRSCSAGSAAFTSHGRRL